MKKLATLTALALSFAATGAFAETLTGYVADAMCAKDPHSVSSADPVPRMQSLNSIDSLEG